MVENKTYNSQMIIGKGAALVEYKTAHKAKEPVHSTPKETDNNNSSDDVAHWGANNLFPQELIKNAQQSTVVLPTLDIKARMLYAQGLEYGHISKKGEFKKACIKEVEDFISHSNLKKYYLKKQN